MNRDWTLVDAVSLHAQTKPDKLAIAFKKQRLTYAQLLRNARIAAEKLRDEFGVEAGDRVMVTGLSKPEYLVVLLAVQYLGGTVVPTDKSALGDSLAELFRYVQPKLFLTDSMIDDKEIPRTSLAEFYHQILAETGEPRIEYRRPDMDSIAEIIFTTGTTGRPKGAMLSYHAIQYGEMNTIRGTNRTEDDIELIPLPLNHSYGLRVTRALLYLGGTIILQNGFMFAKETRKNIETFGCTGMAIVPASVEKLYQIMGRKHFAETFSKLQHLEIGAGSLSVAMKTKLREIIPKVHMYDVWGSSETGGVIFLDITEHDAHLGSLGYPIGDVDIRMLDAEGNPTVSDSPETAGRMIMKGEMQMSGYFGMEEETASSIVDGYLYTNDMVYRTEDGFIYMMGRADDIINVGGEKVSPLQIEDVAGMEEQIRECACISGSDKEGIFEQIPVLFVVTNTGTFDEQRMIQFLSKKIEQYKIPKYFVELDALPRNRMLKIDRKALKRMWEEGDGRVTGNTVISAIHTRRSVRRFEEKPIPDDLLRSIVECGIMAPTGFNRQTWRFTVIRDRQRIGKLKELVSEVAAARKIHFIGFNNPDTLILVSNDRRNEDGIQDSSCAAQNIMLAAHSCGIGSTWINALMELCDEPAVRSMLDELEIPQTHIVWAMLALGYPENLPSAPARRKDVIRWF